MPDSAPATAPTATRSPDALAWAFTSREISIRKACEQHFADIGLNPEEQSSAYENAQARERTQILMDIANMEHGMVLGTAT